MALLYTSVGSVSIVYRTNFAVSMQRLARGPYHGKQWRSDVEQFGVVLTSYHSCNQRPSRPEWTAIHTSDT